MAKTARAKATPPHRGLPEEIMTWEILVRLPAKALLRCRAVCRAWRRLTSAHDFLLAHHARQPSLQILYGSGYGGGVGHGDILAFDNPAATTAVVRLHEVARLDQYFTLEASCDGLLVISGYGKSGAHFFFCCNPATRQHAPLDIAQDLYIMGMYPHRPTGEYRLLLQRRYTELCDQTGFYVYVLGSNQPPRYIGWRDTSLGLSVVPARVHDNLHWYHTKIQVIIVFDTVAESFRRMHAPTVPSNQHTTTHIFETAGTLGIHTRDASTDTVNIWVMQNYEGEVWDFKYQIKLPVGEIQERLEGCTGYCYANISVEDARVILLVSVGQWVLRVNCDGKLMENFHCSVGRLCAYGFRFKETLVQHTFFRH